MGEWLNGDGLYVKFGTDEADTGTAGEYRTNGPQRMVEVEITLANLGTASAILDDNALLPAGFRIEKVEIVNKTAATGDTAVLNVGLIRKDRSTAYDADGFCAAVAIADFNAAGETLSFTQPGSAAGGAFIGTTLAYSGYLVADYDTAAFTAGVVKVRIYMSKP